LAERFRQVADALERGDATASADAREGVEVHRRFLIGVHHRREAIVAAELHGSSDPAVRSALATCASEHPKAERFEKEASALLREARPSAASAKSLAGLLRQEAVRFADHHRWETENLYARLRGTLTKESTARIEAGMRPLAGDAGAATSALMAWTSHANPTAD